MAILNPMTEAEFQDFLARNLAEYAREKVKSGNWTPEEAPERSRSEHAKLLPQGPDTPDHHLLAIREEPDGPQMGAIWLAVERKGQHAKGFIYDLFIFDAFRGKGIASRAMLELESVARALGLEELGLHVFAHNEAARALYERLGYRPTNIVMAKDLGPEKV